MFDLSPSYCSVWFVVGLLQCDVVHCLVASFYLRGTIQTGKTDLISRRYQFIVVSMLRNWSRGYKKSAYYQVCRFHADLLYY